LTTASLLIAIDACLGINHVKKNLIHKFWRELLITLSQMIKPVSRYRVGWLDDSPTRLLVRPAQDNGRADVSLLVNIHHHDIDEPE
jgi:hypothetical protein